MGIKYKPDLLPLVPALQNEENQQAGVVMRLFFQLRHVQKGHLVKTLTASLSHVTLLEEGVSAVLAMDLLILDRLLSVVVALPLVQVTTRTDLGHIDMATPRLPHTLELSASPVIFPVYLP